MTPTTPAIISSSALFANSKKVSAVPVAIANGQFQTASADRQ